MFNKTQGMVLECPAKKSPKAKKKLLFNHFFHLYMYLIKISVFS